MLLETKPDTLLGAMALLRLAQLEAREGDVERASGKLATLIARFAAPGRAAAAVMDGPLESVLTPDSPESRLEVRRDSIMLEARRLHALLAANRDPFYGYDPICGPRDPQGRRVTFSYGLMDLEPRHDHYIENLQALKAQYPNCQIADNIDLEIAKASDRLTIKIQRLEACLAAYPSRDAVPEVLFRLGIAYKADNQLPRSEGVLSRLLNDFPTSVWARQAAPYFPSGPKTRVSRAG